MYIPKLMLLIFNFLLLIIGVIAVSRGLSDHTPMKLKQLEGALDVELFPKIFSIGGCIILVIASLGFWGAEIENRTALITYKIVLCFLIGIEVILIFYFTLNGDAIQEQLHLKLNEWVDDYMKSDRAYLPLDNVQNYLNCCELKIDDDRNTSIPQSCCFKDVLYSGQRCNHSTVNKNPCTKIAYQYFSNRTRSYVWFLENVIGPQIASIIFAHMVAKKILMLQNIMMGKLAS